MESYQALEETIIPSFVLAFKVQPASADLDTMYLHMYVHQAMRKPNREDNFRRAMEEEEVHGLGTLTTTATGLVCQGQ
jgi:hypothetical protein